ncbi:hypothetical protein SLE2022_392820 [Rubroshorea leprosula]
MVMDANLHGIEYNMNEQGSEEPIFEAMGDAKEFFDLLQATNTPLYDGCDDGDTILKWVSHFMNAKTLYNMSVATWNYMLKCTRRWMKLDDRDRISKDFYSAKKLMRCFSLSYKKLKRLYMCRKTAKHMIWHLTCGGVSEKIAHPAGAKAWKHFDHTCPNFASDPRNVKRSIFWELSYWSTNLIYHNLDVMHCEKKILV